MSKNKDKKEIDKAIQHLMDYVQNSERWSPIFKGMIEHFCKPVAQELGESLDNVISELLGEPHGHLAFGYLFEEMVNMHWENEDTTALEAFIKQRGWREGPAGKRYLRAMAKSELQLLEITLVEPGSHIDVRPFCTDEKPVRVQEQVASGSLQPWHCLAARMTLEHKERRFCGGLLPLNPEDAEYIHENVQQAAEDLARDYLDDKGNKQEGDVAALEFAHAVKQEQIERLTKTAFEYFALQALDPPEPVRPHLFNTDDEQIVMTKFHFPFSGDATVLSERLASHPDITNELNGSHNWLSANASNTVLGQIFVRDSILIFRTNSVERGKRGVKLIESLLGNLVGPAMGVHENLEDLVDDVPESMEVDPAMLHDPELQAQMRSFLTEQYRKTLDEPVPILDNLTPRECAKNPKTRQQAIDWLKHLEQTPSQGFTLPFDYNWMWDELGLSAYKPPPGAR